jgi:hypothetical protein
MGCGCLQFRYVVVLSRQLGLALFERTAMPRLITKILYGRAYYKQIHRQTLDRQTVERATLDTVDGQTLPNPSPT